MDPMAAFADLMGRDDDEIELDRAALLFAAVEYPALDVDEDIRELRPPGRPRSAARPRAARSRDCGAGRGRLPAR